MSARKKNLYVSISSHGYGHIGQMTPILNKLAAEYGDKINFTIQCGTNADFLASSFSFDFKHIEKSDDIGMLMVDSLDVQPQKSHRAYKDYHASWPKSAMLKAREVERQRADAVVSNVSYLTLAAADHLGVPSIGMCSLNWAYIYLSYCGHLPGSDEIYQKALNHYRSADHFLIPTPGMKMSALGNETHIGPLSRLGNRYPNFKKRLNLPEQTRLVLVSMGGIPHNLDSSQWPLMENVTWLSTSPAPANRPDILCVRDLPFNFIDVLNQCDLLLCKPGYGMFAEATCNGVPVMYVKREKWPEEPYLIEWLKQHNECMELTREAFEQGQFAEEVAKMLMAKQDKKTYPVSPTGVGEACGYILDALEL